MWFTVASLVGNFLFVRIIMGLPLGKAIAAGLAMTGASWLFVVAVPISLWAYVVVQHLLFAGRSDPFSWIAAALMSALTGAVSGLAVLAFFKQRSARSTFCWLLLVNLSYVAIAVYRMVVYMSAHPPEA
jgi:hypothetical protein